MTPAATGPIARLAYATTEDDARALLLSAATSGATAEECRDAWAIWTAMREADVVRVGGEVA